MKVEAMRIGNCVVKSGQAVQTMRTYLAGLPPWSGQSPLWLASERLLGALDFWGGLPALLTELARRAQGLTPLPAENVILGGADIYLSTAFWRALMPHPGMVCEEDGLPGTLVRTFALVWNRRWRGRPFRPLMPYCCLLVGYSRDRLRDEWPRFHALNADVGKIDLAAVRASRDALWAQALARGPEYERQSVGFIYGKDLARAMGRCKDG